MSSVDVLLDPYHAANEDECLAPEEAQNRLKKTAFSFNQSRLLKARYQLRNYLEIPS